MENIDKIVQDALKLAYIKLVQVGGFDSVDGVKTPDEQARKQILAAINTFDPEFTDASVWTVCPQCENRSQYCNYCEGLGRVTVNSADEWKRQNQ